MIFNHKPLILYSWIHVIPLKILIIQQEELNIFSKIHIRANHHILSSIKNNI